jgi:hypothetical protein
MSRLERIRNFVVDVVLVGGAVSYAASLAQSWLVDHETELAHVAGGLYVVMLPLLLVALVIDTRTRTKTARSVLLWSLVAFYALGWLVPLAIDEHVGIGDSERRIMLGGQLVVAISSVVAIMKLDPNRALRHMSSGVRTIVTLASGAYLLCLEAALMTLAHGRHPYAGAFGMIACAIVGYLPVRLYLAVALEGRKWDLVAMALAFVHFLWRIVTP